MNLTSPSQVKEWCIAQGFHPNRVMGQNFLVDRNALVQIVDAAMIESMPPERRNVLEIGPGLGVLTEELLARGARVTAIEKDPTLAQRLAEALGDPPYLTVLEGDALAEAKAGHCDGFDFIVSNLPYQAGTRILLEILQRADLGARLSERLVILVQTEVGERLAAAPGTKRRGLASVWAQLDYTVEIVRGVKASCFWPRPEIGSSVVRLTRHHRHDDLAGETRSTLRKLAKQAFEHRRKQLGTIFRGSVTSTRRAEELSIEEWVNLAKGFAV